MSKQTINIGASPNDGTGTPLRTSFDYTNQNFTELYTALGGGVGLPGATTQVIFNDGGTNLAGDAGLVYDKTTDALTVGGNITSTSGKFATAASGQNVGLQLDSYVSGAAFNNYILNNDSTAGTIAALNFGRNTSLLYGFIRTNNNSQNLQLGTSGAGSVEFFQNNSTAMTLNSTGLGIGASPSTRLHISNTGDVYARIATTSVAKAGVQLSANGSLRSVLLYDDNAGTTYLSSGATFGGSAQALTLQSGTSFQVYTNNQLATAQMTVDTSGNVGIGVTPSAWAAGYKAIQISSSQSAALMGSGNQTELTTNAFYDGAWKYQGAGTVAASRYSQQSGVHYWFNAAAGAANATITDFATAKMTLDASGILIVGNTVAANVGTTGGILNAPNSGNSYTLIGHTDGSASGSPYCYFFYNSSQIGSITQNGTTGVLYNTSSDYRLKESVKPISGGLARVNALKPSVYNWKSDGSTGEGFLAHELAEVVPAAVSGEKDAVNADGSIKSQGIDMSRIVPILVAAIQELTAEVNALKNA